MVVAVKLTIFMFIKLINIIIMHELVWNGQMIVRVHIYPGGLADTPLPPFYASVRRIHYPCSLLPRVSRFCSALGDSSVAQVLSSGNPIWFEVDFAQEEWIPVPWGRPLGVLADLAMLIKDNDRGSGCTILSLRLVLTGELPGELLIAGQQTEEAARLSYFNGLKEAEALRRTRTRRVMELARGDQAGLWDALRMERTDDAGVAFRTINGRLLRDDARCVPFKLYNLEYDRVMSRCGPVQCHPDLLLGEAFAQILARPVTRAITHGINLDLSMPVAVAMEQLVYPDNLLHIAVR